MNQNKKKKCLINSKERRIVLQSYNKGTHKDEFHVERLIKYQTKMKKLYHYSIFILEFNRNGVRGIR